MQCMTYAPRQSGHFLTCVPLSYAIDLIDPNEYASHTRHPRWIERKATWILIRLRAAFFFSLHLFCLTVLCSILAACLRDEMQCRSATDRVCAHNVQLYWVNAAIFYNPILWSLKFDPTNGIHALGSGLWRSIQISVTIVFGIRLSHCLRSTRQYR